MRVGVGERLVEGEVGAGLNAALVPLSALVEFLVAMRRVIVALLRSYG